MDEHEAEEVLGRGYESLWDPARSAELRALHSQVMETNQPVRRVVRRDDADAGVRWWLASYFPIPASDGRPAEQWRRGNQVGREVTLARREPSERPRSLLLVTEWAKRR